MIMEGPRGARPEEFDSLRELANVVFRSGGRDGDMFAEYPQLFNAENAENLRVCVGERKCVCHVGMTERYASLFGCTIQVCCIGGVATYKEYRGQGLASACFDDAVAKASRDGVDIMIVSGDRNLYRMRGCLRVGRHTAFKLTEETMAQVEQAAHHRVTVKALDDATELPLVTECYRDEPVRFLRPLDDYFYARESRFVMNHHAEILTVRANGDFRGYVIAQTPGAEKKVGIVEYAGDRQAILAALPELFRYFAASEVGWQVSGHDTLMQSLSEETGLQGAAFPGAGTVKLINFPQLMERLHPYWEEKIGCKEAAQLAFRQHEDEYGFRFADDELVTDRDTATRLLFGTPDRSELAALDGQGKIAEVLQAILPLPTLWYGLNYV